MKKTLTLLTYSIISTLLVSCGSSDESPFTSGGGSSTNIISDINFAVGADEPNPAVVDDEGFHGSVQVEIIVSAGDRDNFAVTSGTVHFASEYGLLSASSCQLESTGQCSVTWSSILEGIPQDFLADITVYTLGEESYLDIDGSKNFNDGDIPLTDTAEPFIDINGAVATAPVFNLGVDVPIDLDNSGDDGAAHTPADGLMSVSGCTHSTLCAPSSRIYIFDTITLDLDTRTPPP